jgi:5,5'-dehydrodivanillate O-demethylase
MGLYWAYLGPLPAPPIRRFDLTAFPMSHITVMPHEASWIQAIENNGLDATHIYILHQDTGSRRGTVPSTTRGWIDDLTTLEYREMPFGIGSKLVTSHGYVEEDRIIFPNMLRRVNQLQIHVAIDDTNTRLFKLYFSRDRVDYDPTAGTEPVDFYVQEPEELKSGPGPYPHVRHYMDELGHQDLMAIETQGATASRPDWHLATGDRGVMLFERMLIREMDRVRDGLDPVGVTRDPNEIIDSHFDFYRERWSERLTQATPQGVPMYQRPTEPAEVSAREESRAATPA